MHCPLEARCLIQCPMLNLSMQLTLHPSNPPQNSSRYVEIFTSNKEEVDRRGLTGVMLV